MSFSNQWTIGEALSHGERVLAESGIDESPRLDSEVLLASCLGAERLDLITDPEAWVPLAARERFLVQLQLRADGCPVAHVTGRREFWGVSFDVGPGVLVPRPETEQVVEASLARLPPAGKDPLARSIRVLDLGTGSGCILLALLTERQDLIGFGIDRSLTALGYARRNAARMGLSSRANFFASDLTSGVLREGRRFHLLISNPPYIPQVEFDELPRTVRCFEPEEALLDPGDGTTFHALLLEKAPDVIRPGGWIVLEMGAGQVDRVRSHAERSGAYDRLEVMDDLRGIPRVFCARIS